MSIKLNAEDFTEGELRFPEFGDQRYRPESGTAIVFFSSLLREALHVTAWASVRIPCVLFGKQHVTASGPMYRECRRILNARNLPRFR